jgi:hypothetical protein
MGRSLEEAAHDQPVVYVEGRSDSHPEADALVHVQLTCGLADYGVNRLLQNCRCDAYVLRAILAIPSGFQGPLSGIGSRVISPSAGK